MAITKSFFGKTKNNEEISLYKLVNNNNMSISVITYGGTLTSINVPDKNNIFADVVLGYDTIEGYEKGDKYLGALIGRCGNRIEHGKFTLNGKEYTLAVNNGPNHNHGGIKGFDKVIWNAEIIDNNKNILKLSYLSKDNEEGYPGNLNVTVTYTLTEDNAVNIEYKAVTDAETVVNLTNHSYFNLSGHNSGNILNHKLMVNADTFTVNDEFSIPTGEIRKVDSTPMDFRTFKEIGKEINSDYEQIKFGNGYDHNWMLNANGDISIVSAKIYDDKSGRILEMYTTTPGVQVYTANYLDGSDIGKGNSSYMKRDAICLEAQCVPNRINNNIGPTTILKPGEEYYQKTIYKFSVQK